MFRITKDPSSGSDDLYFRCQSGLHYIAYEPNIPTLYSSTEYAAKHRPRT